MTDDPRFPTEIDVVENFFQDSLENVVEFAGKHDIGEVRWLEFLQVLAQYQGNWSAAQIPSPSPALILQSLATCHDLSRSRFSTFQPFELYKRYLFLPYPHVGVLSPVDASFWFRSGTKVLEHNKRVNAPGWDKASSMSSTYFEFLLDLKPFVEHGYASIIPPKARGRRSLDGVWVEPEFWQLAELETKGWNSEPGRIVREMILSMDHKGVNASNIDQMSHWGRPVLSQFYDDMFRANQLGGSYIVPNRFILRLMEERADAWDSLPKPWKHSPLFRTAISAEIELPDLSALSVKDMLELRRSSELWDKWRLSVEKAFTKTQMLASQGGDTDERFGQAFREEIRDTAAELQREVQGRSLAKHGRSALATFTLGAFATMILHPLAEVSMAVPATGALLQLLRDVLFKHPKGNCLYNHYSMLEPSRNEPQR